MGMNMDEIGLENERDCIEGLLKTEKMIPGRE